MTPYEKIVAELLPCMCGYEVTDGPVPAVAWAGDHFEGCPALYRFTVAQCMRELVELGVGAVHRHADCISSELGCYHGEMNDHAVKLLIEIDRLRDLGRAFDELRAENQTLREALVAMPTEEAEWYKYSRWADRLRRQALKAKDSE